MGFEKKEFEQQPYENDTPFVEYQNTLFDEPYAPHPVEMWGEENTIILGEN